MLKPKGKRNARRTDRLRVPALVLATLLMAGLGSGIVAADHAQRIFADSAEPTIRFDHLVGNEWWVEVKVTTSNSEYHVDSVEATDDGKTWYPLTLRSWGAWAGSFHIETGNEVMFRANQHGGMSHAWTVMSCWFAHPSGAPERCSGYDATFRDAKGNEWWQEVYVSAPSGVSKVDVSINGGDWKPLTLRSWGAWAGSYYAVGGSVVEFRATSPSGLTDKSGCYYWPLATPADCNQGGDFDVSFRNVRGNKYWVETDVVVLKGQLAKVEFRIEQNSGVSAWMQMSKTSWGSYAASTNVPEGANVNFRAVSTAGQEEQSGAWKWPPTQ